MNSTYHTKEITDYPGSHNHGSIEGKVHQQIISIIIVATAITTERILTKVILTNHS